MSREQVTDPVCLWCDCEYNLRRDAEPGPFCDDCAHDVANRMIGYVRRFVLAASIGRPTCLIEAVEKIAADAAVDLMRIDAGKDE